MAVLCSGSNFSIETHPINGNYVLYIAEGFFHSALHGPFLYHVFDHYCMTDLAAVSVTRLPHSMFIQVQFTTSSPLYKVLTVKNMNTLTLDDLIGDWIRKQNIATANASLPTGANQLPATSTLPQGWYVDFNALEDAYPTPASSSPKKDECSHTFKSYYGLRESYQYCTKCDTKKPIED